MIDINATLLIQWGIFVALMVFLNYFLFKPVLRVIDARQAKVEGTFASAEDLQSRATASREEYESKLNAAREKLFVRVAAARESASRESKALMEKAREEALSQVESTRERVKSDSLIVRRELTAKVDSLARGIAGKILERQL
ncbi:MAG: ATP synthase F0 subunit B [Deltaproteobacteria bacterium]|nr:ATP synthase F0 subunit B [Deltaproteobacteria bacterium]